MRHAQPVLIFALLLHCGAAVLTCSRSQAQSPVMAAHLDAHRFDSHANFLHSFPYQRYLEAVPFTALATLQEDRLAMYQRFGDGDLFLYHLGQRFVRLYPAGDTLASLQETAQVGITFLDPTTAGIDERNSAPFRIIGYFILGQVAAKLTVQLDQGHINPHAPDTQTLLNQLADCKIHVTVKRNNAQKLVDNVRQGKFDYILGRVKNKVVALASRLTGDNQGKDSAAAPQQPEPRFVLDPLHALLGGQVSIFTILDRKTGKPLGQTMFLPRPEIKASYVAHDVMQRYETAARRLVVMAGGFTNDYQQPEGLTVDNGMLVNAVIMPDRDGLVLVERNGGIRVVDLDRTEILLPSAEGQTRKLKNPRNNLLAYAELLAWCRTEAVTAFQTQLLAYGHQMRVDASKAPNTLAERRMLALVRTPQNQVLHVVFNLHVPHSLAGASLDAFRMLEYRNLKVEALLNMDTGGQDVLQVFDDQGNLIPGIQGQRRVDEATNLLMYQY